MKKYVSKLLMLVLALSMVSLAVAAEKAGAKKGKKTDTAAKLIICANSVQNKTALSDSKLKAVCEKPKMVKAVEKILASHHAKACEKGDKLASEIGRLNNISEKNGLVEQALSTPLASEIKQKCQPKA